MIRRRGRVGTIASAVLLAALASDHAAKAQDQKDIADYQGNTALIRWNAYMQTPGFVAALNQYTEPTTSTAKSLDELGAQIQKQCAFDLQDTKIETVNAFRGILFKLNNVTSLAGLGERLGAEGATTLVPTCVPESTATTVIVGPGDTARGLLQRYLGTAGNDSLDQLRKLNPKKNLDKLKVGDEIQVPVLKGLDQVRLSEGQSVDALRAAIETAMQEQIKGVTEAAKTNEAAIAVVQASAPAAEPPPVVDASQCPVPVPDPLGLEHLRKVIAINERILRLGAVGPGSLPNASVAVIDNGFNMDLLKSGDDTPFKSWVNEQVTADDAASGTLATLKDMIPAEQAGPYSHGMGVLYQSGGGRSVLDDTDLRKIVSNALKVAPFGYLQIVQENGAPKPVATDLGLGRALERAMTFSPAIINISGGTVDKIGSAEFWEGRIKSMNGNSLVIVGAGNDSRRVVEGSGDAASSIFPAGLGGPDGALSPVVLTVGASSESLDSPDQPVLAAFSNKSELHVDMLAPGCKIPTLAVDGSAGPLESGTSYSAPLVTFIAGLVQFYSQGEDAKQIKTRLLASARMEPSLAVEDVGAGRVLDIDAVSVYLDVVQRGTTPTAAAHVYGRVPMTRNAILGALCTKASADALNNVASSIRRIHVVDGNPRTIRIFRAKDSGEIEEKSCAPNPAPNAQLTMLPFDAEASDPLGAEMPIPATEVWDILFAQTKSNRLKGSFENAKFKAKKTCPILEALDLVSCG